MAVITRISASSVKNNSFQVVDLEGNVFCTVEAVKIPEGGKDGRTNLRITTPDNIQIVKGNGKVLRSK